MGNQRRVSEKKNYSRVVSPIYPGEEKTFSEICTRRSSVPFVVDTGSKKIWYYLSYDVNKDYVRDSFEPLHKCRTCCSNVSKIIGLFGPDGYAIPMKGSLENGPFFKKMHGIQKKYKTYTGKGVFFLTHANIDTIPWVLGKDSDGRDFNHISINLGDEHITRSLPMNQALLNRLWDGSMDIRMERILTDLQLNGFMDNMKKSLRDPELQRKSFWEGRIEYVLKVQEFASGLQSGRSKKWSKMTEVDKMHARIFALFYGDSLHGSENTLFKGSGQVVDCFTDVSDYSSLVSFMNSRSAPETYMVQQVSRALEDHSVKSRFKVSLGWTTKDDLDLWVQNDGTREMIGFSNKTSRCGRTKLDFDANASPCGASDKPVENITLSSTRPSKYSVYVNNYRFVALHDIPFKVVVNLDGYIKEFDGVWPKRKPTNPSSYAGSMLKVTTVNVTQDMISSKGSFPEMSEKQSRKFDALRNGFQEKFGALSSELVDMDDLPGAIIPSHPKVSTRPSTKTMDVLADMACKAKMTPKEIAMRSQMGNMKPGAKTSRTTFDDLLGFFESRSNNISVNIRDFPPSYVTRVSCPEKLRTPYAVNTYYEEGRAPRKPDAHARDVVRYNSDWLDSDWCISRWPRIGLARVTGIWKIKCSEYDGYFLSIHGTRLPPTTYSSDWTIGGGFYPTDLAGNFHIYRDLWHAHHTTVRPSSMRSVVKNTTPAIGVFMHTGKKYTIAVDGVESSFLVK